MWEMNGKFSLKITMRLSGAQMMIKHFFYFVYQDSAGCTSLGVGFWSRSETVLIFGCSNLNHRPGHSVIGYNAAKWQRN